MTGDLEHRQFALQLAERRSWSRHPNRRTRRLPTAAAERPAEPFYTRSSGAASDDNRTASAGHSKQLHACSQRQDAWSFDWCTVIGIGIAAGILGIVLLIGWRQGP